MTDLQELHTDLLSATHTLIKNSMVQIELQHVCGHQDSRQARPFTWDATLNIEVDLLAKTKLQTYTLAPKYFQDPWSQGVCYIGGDQVENFWKTNMQPHQWASNKNILGKMMLNDARDLA